LAKKTVFVRALFKVLKGWGYLPRAPVQAEQLADENKRDIWIREKNMKAFTFYNDKEPLGEIDVIIDSPIPYEVLRKQAVLFDIGEINVPVISITDLIAVKLQSGRSQDLADVDHLRTVLEE
jgi:predicted nucleotidyltransferase